MPPVDTLQAYETLRLQGGLEDKVAKAIVTACTNLLTPSFADLATKADLADIKTDSVAIKSEIATVEANMATKAELAETKADVVAIKSEIVTMKANMATKAELAELKADVVAIKSEIVTMKANMATKAELAETKADLIKWMVGLVVAQLVAMLGLVRFLM